MDISPNLVAEFILNMVAFLFSASVHESAHAWVSSRYGDDLARSQGRISLNPLVHIDPIGTLLFPAIAFFTGAPLIGWAKPTPVNPLRWRNKRVANFWVSAAGAISNFIIAIIAGIARSNSGPPRRSRSFRVSSAIREELTATPARSSRSATGRTEARPSSRATNSVTSSVASPHWFSWSPPRFTKRRSRLDRSRALNPQTFRTPPGPDFY